METPLNDEGSFGPNGTVTDHSPPYIAPQNGPGFRSGPYTVPQTPAYTAVTVEHNMPIKAATLCDCGDYCCSCYLNTFFILCVILPVSVAQCR